MEFSRIKHQTNLYKHLCQNDKMSDLTKTKAVITVLIVMFAGFATLLAGVGSFSSAKESGVVIDFGNRDVIWTGMDLEEYSDPISALRMACEINGFDYHIDEGNVWTVDDRPSQPSSYSWNLWVVHQGNIQWTRISDPYSVRSYGHAAIGWALGSEDECPMPAVDQTGVSFYGYRDSYRIVSLAPSVTESICAVGGFDALVGTDLYSNYPNKVNTAKSSGKISVIGGFTNPSYEAIIKLSPDLVICEGGQSSHLEMAEKLRRSGINAVVLYYGEDISTSLNNIFIVGKSLHRDQTSLEVIEVVEYAIQEIVNILDSTNAVNKRIMLSLSSVKSPWVSGSDTYAADIMEKIYGSNIFRGESGWVMVNAEKIAEYDPELIIVISSEHSATAESYSAMMNGLSAEWKCTSAYSSGNIFLMTDSSSDLISRPGPRIGQATELIARMVHPSSFPDSINVPKYIGDNYTDFLTYTKDIGFN